MLLSNPPKMFKILSVLELSWGEDERKTESRPFHALSFRMQGGADFKVCGKTISVPKNSILFVPKGLPYEMKHTREHLYVVHFKTDKEFVDESLFHFIPYTTQKYQTLFKTMYDIWNNKKPSYYYGAMAVFYSILEIMQKDLLSASTSKNSEKLDFVMKYIHQNFSSGNCSVSILADLYGSSETYFRKIFQNVYGVTPLKYINNLKIEYALELLRSGYFTVNQIAERAGFADPKYFSKVIKKQTQKPPSKI